jgi:predicted dehydrogenase
MGHNHARVISEMSEARLAGVADAVEDAARAVAARYGTRAYSDYRVLFDQEKPEAVVIAVPTGKHAEVALEALARRISVLVEKPIAPTAADGRRIIQAAEAAGAPLMVGHIERFNPAVMALKQRLENGELGRLFQIDARRQGPFPARVRDVGVVIDLAVHDLDIMRFVTGTEIVRVYAETERRVHTSHEDLLTGLARLSDGAVGTLTINWLTPAKIRELYVTGERGMFRVDYLTQDLYFFENAGAQSGQWETLQVLRGVSEGRMIRHVVAKKEPLRAELEAFLAAVRGAAPAPVSGRDGLRALELAQAIVCSGETHQPVALA